MFEFECCRNKEEFLNLAKEKLIICIGGGNLFREAYQELNMKSLSIVVCDNDINKQKNGIVIDNKKIDVKPLDYIEVNDEKCIILITIMMKGFISMKPQLDDICKNIDRKGYLYYSFRKGSSLYERAVEREKEIIRRKHRVNSEIAISQARAVVSKDKLILPKLNVIVTEKCSLRCRDCRALIPHVKKPQDEPLDKVINEIEKILEAVDEVVDIEPIGGEPFLYPYLKDLLSYLCNHEKIRNVCITTNGTVVPDEACMNALKHEKIFVYISDYGYIEKMARIVSAFEKEKISFSIEVDQKWFDVGDFQNRNRNKDELRLEYLNCYCEFVLKYVWDNKIWLCPRAPRLSTLNVFESQHDYIDLNKIQDKKELQKALIDSFFEEYADACNYCNQGDPNIRILPAGLQINDNGNHSRFVLVDREDYEKYMND